MLDKEFVMKTSIHLKWKIAIIALLFISATLVADVIPTNEWVNFYSTSTTLDGQVIPVGSVITAYDPQGVQCGSFTVTTSGQYGFLLVYKDDFTTTTVDEGATAGDTISFFINGHYAIPKGPGATTWTSNGAIIQVNLEGHSNYNPQITSSPVLTAIEDQSYTYQVMVTDIDQDALTYSLTVKPTWLSINSSTGVVSGVPTNVNVGDTTVTVKVEDGHGGFGTQSYTLTVINVNDSPTITTASLPNAIEDKAYTNTVIATDIDAGDVLTFSLLAHPAWLTINSGTGTLSGTPLNDDVGANINVTVKVQDVAGASATKDFYIAVLNINDAPVISGFPTSIQFRSDSSVVINLNDYVHDDDDSDADLVWTFTGNDSVDIAYNTQNQAATLSSSLTFRGTETIVFTVTDDSLANDDVSVTVQVVPYIYPVELSLNQGWNLVSWNVDSDNDSPSNLFSSMINQIDVILGFESRGFTYDPDLPQFSNLNTLDHQHGYWVKTASSATLNITGRTIIKTSPIQLEAGWNLVSYLPDSPDSLIHVLASIKEKIVFVLGFNGGGTTYDPRFPDASTLKILSPKYGYWIKVSESCQLTYPIVQATKGSYVAKVVTIPKDIEIQPTNEWISVFGKELGLSGALFAVGSSVFAKDPDGIICGATAVYEPGKFDMMPIYRDDPYTETDEGAEPGDTVYIYCNERLIDKVVWSSFGDVYQIRPTATDVQVLPDHFVLEQNYPNPFNSSTTVPFQIPKSSLIKLSVYDSQGRIVIELLNHQLNPGFYKYTWDGTNQSGEPVASGIYFYHLTGSSFSKTGKMILLR